MFDQTRAPRVFTPVPGCSENLSATSGARSDFNMKRRASFVAVFMVTALGASGREELTDNERTSLPAAVAAAAAESAAAVRSLARKRGHGRSERRGFLGSDIEDTLDDALDAKGSVSEHSFDLPVS